MSQKNNLMGDILAVNTVIEEVWNYHPSNPNKADIEEEYEKLIIQEALRRQQRKQLKPLSDQELADIYF